jgi:hypothetical protein
VYVAVAGVDAGHRAAPLAGRIAVSDPFAECRAVRAERRRAVIHVAARIIAACAAPGAAGAGALANDRALLIASDGAIGDGAAIEEAFIAALGAAVVDTLANGPAPVTAFEKARAAATGAVRSEAIVIVATNERDRENELCCEQKEPCRTGHGTYRSTLAFLRGQGNFAVDNNVGAIASIAAWEIT